MIIDVDVDDVAKRLKIDQKRKGIFDMSLMFLIIKKDVSLEYSGYLFYLNKPFSTKIFALLRCLLYVHVHKPE